MFDHVTIRVSDRAASERFYATVLRALGIEASAGTDELAEWHDFSLAPANAARPVTRGLHIGFAAPSRAHVDAFWRAGVVAGYRDDGAPGPRPQYSPDYYGGFLLDPDGNSAEAVASGDRPAGHIDHLWIRVADVAAARRFYLTVAPYTRFQLNHDRPELAQLRAGDGTSFSVLAGTPAEHVHLAFGTQDDATVEAFHRAATAAGYRDNGGPGERAVYHRGYYGAYVLDPDGNNVELVHHHNDG